MDVVFRSRAPTNVRSACKVPSLSENAAGHARSPVTLRHEKHSGGTNIPKEPPASIHAALRLCGSSGGAPRTEELPSWSTGHGSEHQNMDPNSSSSS